MTERSFKERKLRPLSLGEIRPRGWLKQQLEIQAEGLSGSLDEFWDSLKDNRWLGGHREGWERGPYYADGLLPLAYLLDDERLKKKSKKWVNAFLDYQREDGWIGPIRGDREDRKRYDPWPIFVVLKVLRQYFEVTGEERVLEAMLNFCGFLLGLLDEKPLFEWGKFRWADAAVSIHWLFEKRGEDWLLDLAEKLESQGYDWNDHFRNFQYTKKQPSEKRMMETHVVNNAMGVKTPGIMYRQSSEDPVRGDLQGYLQTLDRFHGQANGLFTGDEHLAGKGPSRGTELCAVVELMYSLEKLIPIYGDVKLADRLEKIAFNALPATFKPDMWAHQYDQQANQVLCDVSEKGWSNDPDANIFGLEPNFGCCTANMHQGWPKFVSHLFMRKPGGGLSIIGYAPSEVDTEVSGTDVKLSLNTRYPFEDRVEISIDVGEPINFPLNLRVPNWSDGATIKLEDRVIEADPGKFKEIEKTWHSNDSLTITIENSINFERRHRGSVAFSRGPLVFSNPIDEEWKLIGGEPPHGDWEVYPVEQWNYGVVKSSIDNAEMQTGDFGDYIFSPDSPPVSLYVEGRQIDQWSIVGNAAGPIPASPIKSSAPKRDLKLIPYGCTNLRITEFPLMEEE